MPSFFRPNRDSRHRRACLSLYRALLRSGLRIPLPDNLLPLRRHRNPIHSLIERTFRLNRTESSHRLIISALKNGYRFLDLLCTAAESPSEPAYDDILSAVREHVRAYDARARNPILRKGQQPTLPPPPKTWTPVLTLVQAAGPLSSPVYEATNRPLPKEKLKGERKVPVLDETFGFPFLRFSKPQSPRLSRQLSDLIRRRRCREELIARFKGEAIYLAEEEDAWEKLLEKDFGVIDPAMTTYVASVKKSIAHLAVVLNDEKKDMMARGRALWELVQKEKALVEEEKEYWEEWRKRRAMKPAEEEEEEASKEIKLAEVGEEGEAGKEANPVDVQALREAMEDPTLSFYEKLLIAMRPQVPPTKNTVPRLRKNANPNRSATTRTPRKTRSHESPGSSSLEAKLEALRVSNGGKMSRKSHSSF